MYMYESMLMRYQNPVGLVYIVCALMIGKGTNLIATYEAVGTSKKGVRPWV
jgi:hypothetical protein